MKEFNWTPQAKKNELVSAEELAKIAQFNQLKIEVDAINERIKTKMLESMKGNGIKKIENDYFTATYIAPSERVSVDVNKMKSNGIYPMYTKVSSVKESVRINWKEANK